MKYFLNVLAVWESHADIETVQWIQAKSRNETAASSEKCVEASESEEKEDSSQEEDSNDDSTEQEDEHPLEANKFAALKEEL